MTGPPGRLNDGGALLWTELYKAALRLDQRILSRGSLVFSSLRCVLRSVARRRQFGARLRSVQFHLIHALYDAYLAKTG